MLDLGVAEPGFERVSERVDTTESEGVTAEETEAASYATSWADEIRQPRCNWTSGELEAGEYDESISLEDRMASLIAAGIEYNGLTSTGVVGTDAPGSHFVCSRRFFC